MFFGNKIKTLKNILKVNEKVTLKLLVVIENRTTWALYFPDKICNDNLRSTFQ